MNDEQGCSICPPGEEKWEEFYSRILKKNLIQYDYRTPEGKLFTIITPTLHEARGKRDRWLEKSNET